MNDEVIGSKGTKRPVNKKKAMTIAVVAVLIVVVGVGAWYTLRKQVAVPKKNNTEAVISESVQTANTLQNLSRSGQTDAARKEYQKLIDAAKDDKTKSSLYSRYAGMEYNAKNYTEAIALSLKSENISKTVGTASQLGDMYLASGDSKNANIWFKTSYDRLTKSGEKDEEAEMTLKDKIKATQ